MVPGQLHHFLLRELPARRTSSLLPYMVLSGLMPSPAAGRGAASGELGLSDRVGWEYATQSSTAPVAKHATGQAGA